MRRRTLSFAAFILAIIAVWSFAGGAADGTEAWPAYSRDKGAATYSALDQITTVNAKSLRIAWRQSFVRGELRTVYGEAAGGTNYNHTPLVVGGVMYMSSGVGAVTALDP